MYFRKLLLAKPFLVTFSSKILKCKSFIANLVFRYILHITAYNKIIFAYLDYMNLKTVNSANICTVTFMIFISNFCKYFIITPSTTLLVLL